MFNLDILEKDMVKVTWPFISSYYLGKFCDLKQYWICVQSLTEKNIHYLHEQGIMGMLKCNMLLYVPVVGQEDTNTNDNHPYHITGTQNPRERRSILTGEVKESFVRRSDSTWDVTSFVWDSMKQDHFSSMGSIKERERQQIHVFQRSVIRLCRIGQRMLERNIKWGSQIRAQSGQLGDLARPCFRTKLGRAKDVARCEGLGLSSQHWKQADAHMYSILKI